MQNNVVYSIDDNFVDVFLVSLNSLVKYNNNLMINIMYVNLSKKNIKIVEEFLQNKGIKYRLFDVSKELNSISENTLTLNNSLSTYSRLFIPKFIPNVERVLYLDCDTIILDNLDFLFGVDLSCYYVAGVIDPVSSQARLDIGLNSFDNYINAGVLLMNVKLILEDNIVEKFIDFIRFNNGKVTYHDQGTINGVCKDKILYLDHIYNVTSQFYVGDIFSYCKRKIFDWTYSKEEILFAQENAKIIHYTGAFFARPWENGCRHPKKNLFIDNMRELNIEIKNINYSLGYKILAWFFYNTPYFIYININNIVNKLRGILK